MTETWQHGDVTLYCADCLEVLPTLEAGSVDMILTSPPYDDLRLYKGYVFDFERIANELARIIKPGGVIVWIVGDSTDDTGETGTSFRQCLYFKSLGLRLHDTMIYMKAGPAYPSHDKYYQIFEYMFVLSKGRPSTFNPIKDRENRWYGLKWSKIRTRRMKNGDLKVQDWYKEEGNKTGVRFNIWQYVTGFGYHGDELAHQHPASFPEDLAYDHIMSWSNPGDLILDPLMGSCTTGKMAVTNGRRFIGVDIAQEYFDLAKKRISDAQLQIRMPL